MKTFSEIRAQYPTEFLLLLDYEDVFPTPVQREIISAQEVEAHTDFPSMYSRFVELTQQGRRVLMCSPEYSERFVMEVRPFMGRPVAT